jgi:hypothetical protein
VPDSNWLFRIYVDLFFVDCPGQHSIDTIDRLFGMVVAMRRRWQTLRSRNSALKDRVQSCYWHSPI